MNSAPQDIDIIDQLDAVISERAAARAVPGRTAGEVGDDTPTSYTQRLLDDRNLRLKKIGEEAAELVLACADVDRERAADEAGDLIYHVLVALRAIDVSLDDVRDVLARRRSS